MYQILLVDDDMLVRIFLTEMIKWDTYGFSVVGAARDGEEALEMIEKFQPDVVLTDISMPGIDGVELIRRLRSNHFDGVIDVLSCHDDFELVKNAMKEGADDYLLKNHLDDQTAGDFLEKICDQIKKRQLQSKNHSEPNKEYILRHELFERIINGMTDEKAIEDWVQRAGLTGKYRRVIVVLIRSVKQTTSIDALLTVCRQSMGEESVEFMYLREDLMTLLIDLSELSSGHKANEEYTRLLNLIERQAQEYLNLELAMAGSAVCEGQMALIRALRQANETLKNSFYGSGRWQYRKEALMAEELPLSAKRFRLDLPGLLERADDDTIRLCYAAVCQAFEEERTDPEMVKRWIRDCDKEVHFQRNEEQYEKLCLWTDCIRYMEAYLKRRQEERICELPENISPAVYIQEHFSQQIDLRQVSENVNLSSAYFSTIFKQEMGMGFAEFLVKLRLKWVCAQMKESDETIKQISEGAGFQDYPYFCKIFKKNIGVSPTAYRKSVTEK